MLGRFDRSGHAPAYRPSPSRHWGRLANVAGARAWNSVWVSWPCVGMQRNQRSLRMRETTSGRSPMGSRTLARNTML